MNNKELYYFTGQCLTLDEFPERIGSIRMELEKEDFPWEQLVWVSSSHLVLPALYVRFRDAGMLRSIPADLVEYMEEIYTLNLERNESIIDQAREIVCLLSGENIDVIIMKGLALTLNGTYSDLGERFFLDIDLLVPPGVLQKAAGLLIAEGYIPDQSVDEEIGRRTHYPALNHPEKVVPVELHQYPVNLRYNRYLDYNMLANQKIRLDNLDGANTLPVETNLALSFMHSQLKDHDHYYARASLRDLCDIYRLTKSGSLPADIPIVQHFKRIFNDYMALCYRVFGTDRFVYKNTLSARWYLFRIDKNLKSQVWNQVNWALLYPFIQFPRYARTLERFCTNRTSRHVLLEKLKSRNWYRVHFSRYLG